MRVAQLRVGDLVDLDSCPHLGEKFGFWNTEYAEVEHIEHETWYCTCVYWEGIDAVGYSPNQILQVKQRKKRKS
jgi:hypothetical protein